MDTAEKIYEAVKPLPEPLAQEILHYIEFLRARLERQEELNFLYAQEVSMRHVWDNPEDEVWNHVETR